MTAQQPHKNTIQLVALATTAAPSTTLNIMSCDIDGAAKHLLIAAVNCIANFFGLISSLTLSQPSGPLSQVYSFRRSTCRTVFSKRTYTLGLLYAIAIPSVVCDVGALYSAG